MEQFLYLAASHILFAAIGFLVGLLVYRNNVKAAKRLEEAAILELNLLKAKALKAGIPL